MENFTSIKSVLVSDVMESFDFEAVHKYMKSVNWTWALPFKDKLEVPDIETIKSSAESLIWDTKYNRSNDKSLPVFWIQSGGFRAYVDNKTFEVWLEFIVKNED